MSKSVGEFLGLQIRVRSSIAAASLILWVVISAVAKGLLAFNGLYAVFFGLAVMILHWCLVVWHHYGHYAAAKKSGYPMRFVVLWGLLGVDIYPKDEGDLPASVHIQRALGGPVKSFQLALALTIIMVMAFFVSEKAWWLALFVWLDNLLVFTVGAFVPLDFIGIETDGSTLLKWRGKR